MSHIPAERCLSIVELLAEQASDLPLGTISERLDLPKSGTHRLLGALIEKGWAQQDPQTGHYRLTMRLAILGQRFYMATGLPDICQPLLDDLASACGEYVRLAVVDGEELVWVAHAQGARGGLMYQPALQSDTVPLHATASGKIWLCSLPVEQAMRIVLSSASFENPEAYGPNVSRSMEQVMQELQKTTGRGYGIARNEAEQGVSAMAMTVRAGEGGPIVGTVSIAGPSARLTEGRFEELLPLLDRATASISALWPARLRKTVAREMLLPGPAALHQDHYGRQS